jgi:16S rRNA A1518/A1519 N6-dimethyltransferase RsmA/KsgA/DIM1 with predicted DNA glycosylase/AP lyase activity
MSWNDFMKSSWSYLQAIGEGYRNKDIELWRHTREIVAIIYNKNNKRTRKSSELIKLPTDKIKPHPETKTERLTPERFKELAEMYKKIKFKKI